MTSKYTHLELNKDRDSFAGYYTPQKEVRLKYNGREVLYVVGQATIEASCCAAGSWNYVLIPGFIVNWQNEANEADLPVSEIEPISDEETRNKVRNIIQSTEAISQIEFW